MNPQRLRPYVPPAGRPIRAILLGSGRKRRVLEEAERLRPVILEHAQIVASDFSGVEDMSAVDADLAIVLGGDGAILRAAHQRGDRQLPTVAVNLGKIGFLADIPPGELANVLANLRAGRLMVTEHLMFECRVIRPGEPDVRQLGLNEVAIRAGAPFLLMDIDLYVDSELATTYSGDGLIVGTPVGSTAYGLSAGGPILRKDLEAFVIMPLSPHALTNRPVVDSADRVYEMAVSEPHPEAWVVVDGRVLCRLGPEDRVRVGRAQARFQMLTGPGHSYYRTLREKLGWSGQLRRANNGL
ncbi:MAG: NAD(+)/NADH kinase [Thermoguttaceae bacterium]|jgi:NAD+ kinase